MAKKTSPQKDQEGASHAVARGLMITKIIAISLACVCVVVFGVAMYVEFAYTQTVFPGVHVGTQDVSGNTITQSRALLADRVAEIEEQGIRVSYNGDQQHIESTVASESGIDTAFPLYEVRIEHAVDQAYAYGRGENGLSNVVNRFIALVIPRVIDPQVELQEDRLMQVLSERYSEFETQPQDAHLQMDAAGAITISASASGSVFPFNQHIDAVIQSLMRLEQPSITLALETAQASIQEKDVETFRTKASLAYASAPITLTWEDKTWALSQEDVAKSLDVSLVNGKPSLVMTQSGLQSVLDAITSVVDIEAKDARFAISDGKVQEFQSGAVGRTVDVPELLLSLAAYAAAPTSGSSIALAVTTVEPDVKESEAATLGITELVASATTNFKGSPTNRRKNIANGVHLLNGLLIKPGETFSLVKALSPIETSNGYLPELVIKGNRTIPEVGGGLCQIGTTMFRVALNAGLPIVERKNHSYRVSYYEPPVGMDATIYDPAPDFKFTNDYGSYLLLQGHVDGDNVTFDFWGTKDNRIVEMTEPKVYNITSPGPTKYIESDDVAPGQQRCIEKAHNGASAEFTYTVTYSSGEKKQETFYSKYKAWQAVCLVGKTG